MKHDEESPRTIGFILKCDTIFPFSVPKTSRNCETVENYNTSNKLSIVIPRLEFPGKSKFRTHVI